MHEIKSGLIPESFIETIIEKTDIFQQVSRIVSLKSSNSNSYKGLCPFHNEKTPSFYVHKDKQYYHCFGCGANGNVIKFIMQTKNLTFPDTIKFLAEELSLTMPVHCHENQQYKNAYTLLSKAQAKYKRALANNKNALEYLKQRGLSESTREKFGIGYACDFNLEQEEFELAKTLGLLNVRNTCYFFDRITFPIQNNIGKIVGFGGRSINEAQPKYLNSKESFLFHKSEIIYGLFQAKQETHNYIIVVEGYMDVISLHEHGIKNSVATLGTAITAKHITSLFKYYEKIAFCFDGDEAGQNAAWRTLEQVLPILNDGKEIKFLILPKGDDPDSLIRKSGKVGWKILLANGLSLEKYFFNYFDSNYSKNTIAQKANYAKSAQNLINKMQNSIIKQLMQKKLEEIIEINIEQKLDSKIIPKVKLNNLEQAIKILVHNPSLAKNCVIPDILKNSQLDLCKLFHNIVELCVERDFNSLASLKFGSKTNMLYSDIKRFAEMPFDEIDEQMLVPSLNIELLNAELNIISAQITNNITLNSNKDNLKNLLCRKSEIINLLNELRESPND